MARGARFAGNPPGAEGREAAGVVAAARAYPDAGPYIFETEDLHFSYTADAPELRGMSFGIPRGAVTTLLGANACGKTTLLRLLCRDLSPTAGRVLFDGADIRSAGRREFAKRAAVVHQKTSAPDDLTVRRLAAYGRLAHRGMFRAGTAEDDEKIELAMERAGVLDLAWAPIGRLSGGQRQRAFIAMALAQDAQILILDEPTTFLDVRYQIEIMRLIRALNERHGITAVMVLHDINQALLYSDEIIGLAGGRVLVQGPPEKAINADSIRGLYGIGLDVREDADSGRRWVLPPARDMARGARGPSLPSPGGSEMCVHTVSEKKEGSMKKILRLFFIVLGFISLGLGALGVVLPVLPTTPFLLLTAFCFAQGSARFHRWFTGTKLYRRHLDDFVRTKSMTVKTKASILTAVTVLLSLAIYFAPWPHARIAMGVVLAWHWWYFLLRVKTIKPGAGEARDAAAELNAADGARAGAAERDEAAEREEAR
jgi:iron complex transport system ATP-binding protein